MTTTAPQAGDTDVPWLDRAFRITERGSTVGGEIRGGFVTFFAMAYILVLNPLILSGPDSMGGYLGGGDEANIPAIAAATALVAGLCSILMGAVANYPLALAAGMGLNAFVMYGVASLPGMTWADAMGLVVLEGIAIFVLALTGLREKVFLAVPRALKVAITVGIGLFIAFIGLVDGGIIRPAAGTPVELGVGGYLTGWPTVVFLVGLFLIAILMVRKVRGAILIGIGVAAVLAIVLEAVTTIGPGGEDNATGWSSNVPALPGSFGELVQLPDFSTLGQVSLFGAFTSPIGWLAALLLAFSLMLTDFFDTMGTMVAVGAEGDLLDEDGNPPHTRRILLVDAIGTSGGGLAGASTATSFIESAAGVADGARTGLAPIVTGTAFLGAIFLAPLTALIPFEAATPALVIVGFMMMTQVTAIPWKDLAVALPAFLTIIFMPFSYSIATGIGVGFIAYTVLTATRRGGFKQVHWIMWISAAAFVVYFISGPLQEFLLG
ncbi:NCS2 family permease [Bogoriella caseilytica]|uniref:AGZA family xanthine/uracil permease-like MFS transporter n=1 Tax=Bogoriella caseilytica TaxID=56055 RepID=A0A3N2BAQ1_9MICO|nr:NCS2 family permease [Bogoriella caseilytica]ROR72339.1 AGZA family xanthine/uracil permease-like MFS transporter [Bogoriella caseilytica]